MEVEWVMKLPEGLDRSVINSVIVKLLKIDSADTRYSDCDICDAMGEVFFRMGHRPEPLYQPTIDLLDKWVCSVWRLKDEDLVDCLAVLLASFPLVNSRRLLTESLPGADLDPKIAAILQETADSIAKNAG